MQKSTLYRGIVLVVLALVFAALACVQPGKAPSPHINIPAVPRAEPTQPPETGSTGVPLAPTQTRLTVEMIKNADYSSALLMEYLPNKPQQKSFRLVNGEYRQKYGENDASELVITYLDSAFGDLDGDGVEDAVVILNADAGGTGGFRYLVAMINRDAKPVDIDTFLLGDRVKITGLSIKSGMVGVDLLQHAATDPACCPSQPVHGEYEIVSGRLESAAVNPVLTRAAEALSAIKEKNMEKLAGLALPGRGVRFSPYPVVTPADLVFNPKALKELGSDSRIFKWGSFDGSGKDISMPFNDYYSQFVYSKDFSSAPTVNSYDLGSPGKTINNLREYYPASVAIEYYFPGTDQYSGMDWRSLILVFTEANGTWYLEGILNGQWTI